MTRQQRRLHRKVSNTERSLRLHKARLTSPISDIFVASQTAILLLTRFHATLIARQEGK